MFNLKDKVRVTERAKKDTYNNDWWTEKDLIIDHVDKEHDLSEEGQGLYSFVTVDGEEVPCSLYDYELELVESSLPSDVEEMLNTTYDLVDYNVDANIDESEEIRFLEGICDDFTRNCGQLDNLIRENMDPFFGYSFEDKLEFAKYIEDSIDENLKCCGASSLRQALDGGIVEYLFSQFFSNAEAVYINIIFTEINDRIDKIQGKFKEEMLKEKETLFLNFEVSELEDLVEEFVNDMNINYVYDGDLEDFYMSFCGFLSDKLS